MPAAIIEMTGASPERIPLGDFPGVNYRSGSYWKMASEILKVLGPRNQIARGDLF